MRNLLSQQGKKKFNPRTAAAMFFLNATDPATVKLAKRLMIDWGFKAQRFAHGVARRFGLIGAQTAHPPATTGSARAQGAGDPLRQQADAGRRAPAHGARAARHRGRLRGADHPRPGHGRATIPTRCSTSPAAARSGCSRRSGSPRRRCSTTSARRSCCRPATCAAATRRRRPATRERGHKIVTDNRVLFHRVANTLNYLDIRTVVVSCGTCMDQLEKYEFGQIFPGCRLLDIHEYLLEKGVALEGVEGVRYLYHDPCHSPMKTLQAAHRRQRADGRRRRAQRALLRRVRHAGDVAPRHRHPGALPQGGGDAQAAPQALRAPAGGERFGGEVKILTSCPSCLQGLSRFDGRRRHARPTTSSSRWRSGSSAPTGWPSTWRAPIAAASSASSSESAPPPRRSPSPAAAASSACTAGRGGGHLTATARAPAPPAGRPSPRRGAAQRGGEHGFGRRRRVVEQERCADRDDEKQTHDQDGDARGEAADDAGAVLVHGTSWEAPQTLQRRRRQKTRRRATGPREQVAPRGVEEVGPRDPGAGLWFRSRGQVVHALTIRPAPRGRSGAFGSASAEYSRFARGGAGGARSAVGAWRRRLCAINVAQACRCLPHDPVGTGPVRVEDVRASDDRFSPRHPPRGRCRRRRCRAPAAVAPPPLFVDAEGAARWVKSLPVDRRRRRLRPGPRAASARWRRSTCPRASAPGSPRCCASRSLTCTPSSRGATPASRSRRASATASRPSRRSPCGRRCGNSTRRASSRCSRASRRSANVRAKLLQRGLYVGKQLVLVHGLARRVPPPRCGWSCTRTTGWSEMLDCDADAVSDPLLPNGVGISCYSTYSHALLLGLADPCAMSIKQIQLADRWLEMWARKVHPVAGEARHRRAGDPRRPRRRGRRDARGGRAGRPGRLAALRLRRQARDQCARPAEAAADRRQSRGTATRPRLQRRSSARRCSRTSTGAGTSRRARPQRRRRPRCRCAPADSTPRTFASAGARSTAAARCAPSERRAPGTWPRWTRCPTTIAAATRPSGPGPGSAGKAAAEWREATLTRREAAHYRWHLEQLVVVDDGERVQRRLRDARRARRRRRPRARAAAVVRGAEGARAAPGVGGAGRGAAAARAAAGRDPRRQAVPDPAAAHASTPAACCAPTTPDPSAATA